MGERISDKPLINPADRKEYMFYLDKEGYLAKAKYAVNRLSDKERAARDLAKKEKKIAFEKRVKANAEKRATEAKEKVANAKAKAEEKAKKLQTEADEAVAKAKELGK